MRVSCGFLGFAWQNINCCNNTRSCTTNSPCHPLLVMALVICMILAPVHRPHSQHTAHVTGTSLTHAGSMYACSAAQREGVTVAMG